MHNSKKKKIGIDILRKNIQILFIIVCFVDDVEFTRFAQTVNIYFLIIIPYIILNLFCLIFAMFFLFFFIHFASFNSSNAQLDLKREFYRLIEQINSFLACSEIFS